MLQQAATEKAQKIQQVKLQNEMQMEQQKQEFLHQQEIANRRLAQLEQENLKKAEY